MKGYFKFTVLIIATLITAILSVFLYSYGSNIGTMKAAQLKLRNETIQLKRDNIEISKENKELTKRINSLTKETQKLTNKDTELKEVNTEIKNYQSQIELLKKELSELSTADEVNSRYAAQINNVSNDAIAAPKTYTDTTLISGKDITPGRYCIKGNGNFRIVKTTNNNVIESQNLKIVESNSFTAVIENDCNIIIEGKLSFTKVN